MIALQQLFHNPLEFWGFVGTYITIFIALAALLIGIRNKRIAFRVLLDAPINILPEEVQERVSLRHNSTRKLLRQPTLVLLQIKSAGREAVEQSDYALPICFTFKGRTVVAHEVLETKPPELKTIIDQSIVPSAHSGKKQEEVVMLPEVNLNRGDQMKMIVILSGSQDMSKKEKSVECIGYLKRGGKIVRETRRPITGASILSAIALILTGAILASLIIKPVTPLPGFCVPGKITVGGATGFATVVRIIADEYQKDCPGATVDVQGGGSIVGLQKADSGDFNIGLSDRSSSLPPEYLQLQDHRAAGVIFAVVVNSDVTGIHNLSKKEIQDMYAAMPLFTNWKQLGGPNLPITLVGRDGVTSGTYWAFWHYILQEPRASLTPSGPGCTQFYGKIPPSGVTHYCQTEYANKEAEAVQKIPGAIGYIDLATLTNSSGVEPIAIDGIQPLPGYAKIDHYKFWSIEHMYTKGPGNSLTRAFLDYMRVDFAKNVLTNFSYIDTTILTNKVLNAHSEY